MSNSKYIRLQELVIDTFNLDAPVEIEKGALLLESASKTVLLQLRLNVLDNVNEISSTSLTIYGFTDSGEPVEGFSPFIHTYPDVYLQGKKTFGDRIPIILDSKIRKVNVEVDKVVYRNGDVWRNSEKYFKPPAQKRVSSIKGDLQPQFEREVRHLSETDKQHFQYVPQRLGEYWLCTCGRPNKEDYKVCSRCGLRKEVVFHVTDEDNLRNNLQKFNEQARITEEKRVKAEAENKAVIAKKKRQLTIVLIALFAIGSLLSLFFFVIQPAIKYNQATALLTNKDFDGAVASFTALEDYKDSSEMVKESTYQKAVDFLASKRFDESDSIFSSLGEYKDSAEMIKESKYQKAVDYLTQEKFDEAISIFSSLSEYKDSTDMLNESNYQKAVSLLNAGEFDSSESLFTDLGDYKDSSDLALESRYQKASRLLLEKNYDEAISIFSTLKTYKDSQDLENEANYQKAVDSYNNDDCIGAHSIFKKIIEYKDSKTYVSESIYKCGNQLFAGKYFEQAIGFFSGLGDFKDSATLLLESKYLLAQQYLNEYNYSLAEEYFIELGDYKESKTLLAQAIAGQDLEKKYNSAIIEYLNGNFNNAKNQFTAIADYRDSKSYINKTAVLTGIQGTWQAYDSQGEKVRAQYVFVGWSAFYINMSGRVMDFPDLLPEEVTESSIQYHPFRDLSLIKDHYVYFELVKNSIVNPFSSLLHDDYYLRISSTTNNSEILNILRK